MRCVSEGGVFKLKDHVTEEAQTLRVSVKHKEENDLQIVLAYYTTCKPILKSEFKGVF